MKLLAVIFTATILFSLGSCSEDTTITNSADISNLIPANATGVFLMNTKQLLEKVDYATLKGSPFFKEMIKGATKKSTAIVPFLEDPESTGINMTSNIGFYFSIPKEMKYVRDFEFAFILPVADRAKTDAAVLLALKELDGKKPETKDAYTITTLESDLHLIQSDNILAFTSYNDDAKIKELIKPSGKNINSNANFGKHSKENKDILFWMNGDPLFQMLLNNYEMQITGVLEAAQISKDALEGNFMSLFYDFQKGKIDAGTTFDFSDVLVREFGEVFPNELSVDYSKYIPRENLATSMTFGINFDGILNFMVSRGLNLIVDQYLGMSNLDLEKIEKGITGDIAIGIYPSTTPDNEPATILALGLKDKVFMEKLLALAGNAVTKEGDKYIFTGQQSMMDPTAAPMQFFAVIKDDVILTSNSSTLLDKAGSGNSTNEIVEELQAGWMGIFADYNIIKDNYNLITNYLPIDSTSLNLSKIMNEYQSISRVKMIGKNNTISSQVIMKNSTTNSLKSLIEHLGKAYQDRAKFEDKTEPEGDDEFDEFDDFDEEIKEMEKNT